MPSSDADDEDLKAAIALSLAEAEGVAPSPVDSVPVASEGVPSRSLTGLGIAGLDRAAMERERLARQAGGRKRERSISPPGFRGPRKAPKLEKTTLDLPSGARLNMFSTLVQQDQTSRKSGVANDANRRLKAEPARVKVEDAPSSKVHMSAHGELVYPHGVVKKTWAFGHDRTGDEIKLEEVLEKQTLRTAVISAFQWDTDWLLSKLKVPSNGGSTKCVFVMQAKDEAMRKQMMGQTEGMRSFLRLCFPPMEGQVHCMHSKLMLLFHPQKLRIAIPTANLLNFDWGETGVMENSCFLIDLPRLPTEVKVKVEELTAFGQELIFFLEKQGLDDDIRSGVLNFDFSATRHMAFVHTVGGILYGDEAERTGLPGLGRAVRTLGLQTDDLEIDFCASSIGSLNDEYLRATHSAARGVDLIAQSAASLAKTKADFFKPGAGGKKASTKSIRDQMRIYFPTADTVRASTAGAAGTICLSRQWYENMPFPRSVFRDYVSVRNGLLSHNKIMYGRGRQDKDSGNVAWIYVGSSNMSESAWGKLVYDKKAKAWKINCRNWECGVLLPVPEERLNNSRGKVGGEVEVKKERVAGEDSETESEDEGGEAVDNNVKLVGMEVFSGIVDPPFQYPGQVYGDREPWYFKERTT